VLKEIVPFYPPQETYMIDHTTTDPQRYAYRVVALFDGRDAGLVGLATTRDRAADLRRGTRLSSCVRRIRVSQDVYAAIAAREDQGLIPRDLPLSLAAHT